MSDAQRTLTVSVVTPEGAAYEGEATHVVAPSQPLPGKPSW